MRGTRSQVFRRALDADEHEAADDAPNRDDSWRRELSIAADAATNRGTDEDVETERGW
jgi:hypothetical protein